MSTTDTTDTIVTEIEVTKEQAIDYLKQHGTSKLLEQIDTQDIVGPIELAKAIGVKPQMIYNYIRNNRINGVHHNSTQKLVISIDGAAEFVAKRLTREANKRAKVEAELNAK